MNEKLILRLREAVRQEIYAVIEVDEVGADGYTGNSKLEQRKADELWGALIEESGPACRLWGGEQ